MYAVLVLRADHAPQSAAAAKGDSIAEQIGLDVLADRMGRRVPIGRGIVVGHVEGEANRYLPRADQFRNVQFIPRSGAVEPGDHAHATASRIYGSGGFAPGVRQVHCFSSNHWLGGGCLGAGTNQPPESHGIQLFNHSWIADWPAAPVALRRMDYLIDRDDCVMVVGVNNGEGSTIPSLLGDSYNAIAVGNYQGQSSGGTPTTDVPGRCKPDIVAPGGKTSFATPIVTAVVARLMELADRMGDDSPAQHAQVIKAVLLTGAEKPDGWHQSDGRPLALHYGAGRVRLDHSALILERGPVEPGMIESRYGWAFQTLTRDVQATWRLDQPAPMREMSIVLVWHRRIDGRMQSGIVTATPRWDDTPRLADFDLSLMHTDDAGASREVAVSRSAIDNVEHIYLRDPQPGRYTITVTRKDALDEPWDVALAWRMQ